jgi:hypothetical protein
MKLKYIEHSSEEVETDLDLPVYFYFQDELCNDELVMIAQNKAIIVKNSMFGNSIKERKSYHLMKHYLRDNVTTKEHFDMTFKEVLESMLTGVGFIKSDDSDENFYCGTKCECKHE